MAGVIHILLTNVIVASALALVIGLIALRLKRPALVHSLWILVLLKLVTPPVVSVGVLPAGLASVEGETASEIEAPIATGKAAPAAVRPGDSGAGAQPDRAPPSTAIEPASAAEPAAFGRPVEAPTPPSGSGLAFDLVSIGLGGWGAVSLLVFLVAFVRAVRFGRLLARGEPAPPAVQRDVRRLAASLGLSRCPAIQLVPGRVSPLVWALPFTRPRLVVPSGMLEALSRDELESLLAHELAHVKRRDHWVRWLELLVTGIFWWLPLVWLARRALRSAEEQCCDAWVVWSLPGRAEAYARALLHTVEFLGGARTAMPPVASGARHVRQLERRLTMIMERTPPRMLGTAARLAVAVAAVLMLSFLPTWAQESREDEVREVKQKLHRIERAMAELRQAGLEREVEHLARLADKFRRDLDRIDAVNGKRVPPRPEPPEPPRRPGHELEERKRKVAALHEHIARLKESGRHEEARAAHRKLQANLKALQEHLAGLAERHAEGERAEAARKAGTAERDHTIAELERQIVVLEHRLAELKAHHEYAVQAGRRHGAAEVEEEIDRTNRELDNARRALQKFMTRARDPLRGNIPTEADWERAASAHDEKAVQRARARIEVEEHARQEMKNALIRALVEKRLAALKQLEDARDSGLIVETENLEREIEKITIALEKAKRDAERPRRDPLRVRGLGEGSAPRLRILSHTSEAEHELRRTLEEHQVAIAKQQTVIADLERTLAETTRRYERLRLDMEKLERALRDMKLHRTTDPEWKTLEKKVKDEKKRRKV